MGGINMENNINILDELNKGCCMGMDALDLIIPKVEENTFKDLLEKQRLEYQDLSNRIDDIYRTYTDKDIHETKKIEKIMTWYGIEKDTILDNSVSKLADLLIKGTNMGIIEGKRLLNNKTMDKKVHKICNEYVNMQEAYLEKLKEFL
jgi:hypothetical protein